MQQLMRTTQELNYIRLWIAKHKAPHGIPLTLLCVSIREAINNG